MGFEGPETRGRDFSERSDIFEAGLEDPTAVLGNIRENWREARGPRKKKLEGQMSLTQGGPKPGQRPWGQTDPRVTARPRLFRSLQGGKRWGREGKRTRSGDLSLTGLGRGHHSLQERSEGCPAALVSPSRKV